MSRHQEAASVARDLDKARHDARSAVLPELIEHTGPSIPSTPRDAEHLRAQAERLRSAADTVHAWADRADDLADLLER